MEGACRHRLASLRTSQHPDDGTRMLIEPVELFNPHSALRTPQLNPGRLEAIWVKRVRRGPMDAADRVRLVAGRGIVGNTNQGGRRQVTLIEREVWDGVMERLQAWVDPSVRRANLMVSGVSLAGSRDRVLRIGGCRIRIRGETKPCHQMDEALPGLKDAMWPGWQGGAFAEVLDDGEIAVGDLVRWEGGELQL
jgi:MOSC domain-containing protein YiiM